MFLLMISDGKKLGKVVGELRRCGVGKIFGMDNGWSDGKLFGL